MCKMQDKGGDVVSYIVKVYVLLDVLDWQLEFLHNSMF